MQARFCAVTALLPLLLSSCGYGASRMVHAAQISMVGMTANDLRACAGPPDKVTKLNASTDLYTYLYKPGSTGGFVVELPLNLGGLALGGTGTYCSANLRLVDSRVTEVHYTGNDDRSVGEDGLCAPLIRGCMREPEPSMREVGGASYDHASAFHAPPVPPQPPASEEAPPASAAPSK